MTVWQSQLAANDFPPVCAMCGAPAEAWRKFNFSTAPPWAFWVGGLILSTVLARRASGYLPMTRACVQKLRVFRWSIAGVLLLPIVCWIAAIAIGSSLGSDPTWRGVTTLLSVLTILLLLSGLVTVILFRNMYGPTGKVLEQRYGQYEPVIELQRVHPNFVVAVQEAQQARAAQYTPAGQYPLQPGSR